MAQGVGIVKEPTTLEEVRREYQIENNTITSPGRFEGGPEWTPLAYNLYTIGETTYLDEHNEIFKVDEEQRKQWGLDEDAYAVVLCHSTDGFINAKSTTRDLYEHIMLTNTYFRPSEVWSDTKK